jgi:glucosamine-6-phosphate deaminase
MPSVAMPEPLRTFTVDSLSVMVFAQPETLAKAAALVTRQHLQEILAAQNRAAVILATAHSQLRFSEALAGMEGMDWSQVTFFHMAEFLGISAEHQASFRRLLREPLISRIKPLATHYLEGDAAQPLDECERYARLLRTQPLDLCCLGMGENARLAFNDATTSDFADPRWIKIVKLDPKCRLQQVGEGLFPHLPAVPQYALTLTLPTLCSAKRIVCVVPEKRQAQAVKDTLQGPITPACPASILRRQARATLFLDADSASLL